MAYQFPLNGGRINASIGGNSTSNGAGYSLISTGTMLLAGGNNITLSQNGSAITISGANAPSGSIKFSAGANSASLSAVTFADSNGVSFGLNGSTITATVATNYAASNHSHGNPTLNLTNLTGTTASASNGLTLSLSAAAQNPPFAFSNSQTSYSSGTVQFLEAANAAITIASTTGSKFNVSVPAQSSLSQTGIVSISRNGSTISIGAPAYSAGISTNGNTSGTTGFATNQLMLAGGNNVTLSQATGAGGNTLTISAANQSAQTQSNIQGVIASGSTNYTGNISFANSNNITFGLSNNTITASYGGGNGIAIAGGGTTYTSGTANLSVAGGALTITSGAGQAFNFSAPGTSSLSATGIASISINGNTISIGAPAYQAGISTNGNTSGTTGLATNQLVFAGGNNVTLSQATGAGGNTLTISAASQTVQTQNLVSIQGSTGNISFVNGNGVTFGGNASNISASVVTSYAASNHSHGNPTLALTNLTGTTASASNGLTISLSAAAAGGGGGVALYDGAATISSGSARISATGALTASINGQTLNLSVPAQSSLYAAGIVSLSNNGSSISISAPAYSAGITNIGNTSGTLGFASNQLVLAGGNNITLSQATGAGGNTITINGAAGGGGGGIALANSQTNFSSGTVGLLEASGALTIGSSTSAGGGQTYNISAPAQSNISATGAVSISTAGNTVFIGAPYNVGAAGSVARWEYPNQVFSNISTIPNGVLSLQHLYIPFNISVRSARIAASISASSLTSSGTSASQNMSLYMALYTLNGSTLSSVVSGSNLNSFTYSSAAAGVASFNGIKELTTPMSINLTPGEYWLGAMLSSSSTSGTGFAYTIMGNSMIGAGASIGVLGASINASARDVLMGQGLLTTAAIPSTIGVSNIVNTGGGNAQRAAFYHVLYNNTY